MQTDATMLANNTQHCGPTDMMRPFAWALHREPTCNMWIHENWYLPVRRVCCLETWPYFFFIPICKQFEALSHEINKRLHSVNERNKRLHSVNASFRCGLTILAEFLPKKSSISFVDWPLYFISTPGITPLINLGTKYFAWPRSGFN